MPILTAKVGTNADLFPDVLALYVPKGSRVLDMTYGKGVFWRKVNEADWDLVRNDIASDRGEYHYDFRHIQWLDASFDAVVLDPPYIYHSGAVHKEGGMHTDYRNDERAMEGIYGVPAVDSMFQDGMDEARRLLRPGGHCIVKCMDQIVGGYQVWQHITLLQMAEKMGYIPKDLFVLVRNGPVIMRHPHQIHARKNHSYFLVFQETAKAVRS